MARKEGSKNKYSRPLREAIIEEFETTPALEIMRRAMADPIDYARANHIMKGRKGEKEPDIARAARRQESLMVALLPYTEKKMPTEIIASNEKRILVAVANVAPDGQISADKQAIDLRPANLEKIQRKQALSELDGDKSDNEKSDARD